MPSKSKEELAREYFRKWINQRSAQADAIMKKNADLLAAQEVLSADDFDIETAFIKGYAAGLESEEVKGLANVIGAVIERYETKNSPQASNLLKGCTYGTYLILRLALQAFQSKIGGAG